MEKQRHFRKKSILSSKTKRIANNIANKAADKKKPKNKKKTSKKAIEYTDSREEESE